MKEQKPKLKINWVIVLLIASFIVILGVLIHYLLQSNEVYLDNTQLDELLKNKMYRNKLVTFDKPVTGYILGDLRTFEGVFKVDGKYLSFRASTIDKYLPPNISEIKFPVNWTNPDTRTWWSVLTNQLINTIFFIILLLVFSLLLRRFGGAGAINPFMMSKSRAKSEKPKTRFTDVAGIQEEKQELEELVDYLKFPKKYIQMGARLPKGVMLIGPPGTGKTLLAKAVAGEAGVPFSYISGSDFEEVFIGIGASRVREMFNNAKKVAPCIIFIDEIDSIGRRRNNLGVTNEQTLNQLLSEMDGFEPNAGIIIIAATNRAEVLDEALLRPGRFDRKIIFSLPDIKAREQILRLHARNKNISKNVNFQVIARKTVGFSGADLENVLNEAALFAARCKKTTIGYLEIDEAIDRVISGPAKLSRKMAERDKKIVAYHEAGHCLVKERLAPEGATKVDKVTIIARGFAGGYTRNYPKEDTYFHSKSQLFANIAGLMGGIAAEEVIFGERDVTTGAAHDLKIATKQVRDMVTKYAMAKDNKAIGFMFANLEENTLERYNVSNKFIESVDNEIKTILHQSFIRAKEIIEKDIELLKIIAESLMLLETIVEEQIDYIIKNGTYPPEVLALKNQLKSEDKQNSDKTEDQPNDDDQEAVVISAKPLKN